MNSLKAVLMLMCFFSAIPSIVFIAMKMPLSACSCSSNIDAHFVTATEHAQLGEVAAYSKSLPDVMDVSGLFNTCHNAKKDNLIVFAVVTAPANFEKRQKIRNTWGSVKRHKGVDILTAFFIGAVTDVALQGSIILEARAHKDIIQDDSFIDTYRNLTIKSLSILRWTTNRCPNALCVVKVDDDTLVNPYNTISFLYSTSNSTLEQLVCVPAYNAKPRRNKNSKWYVSFDMYNGTTYPRYCQGFGYVIPASLTGKLLEASAKFAILPMEDVYVTGILRESTGLSHLDLDASLATTCGELIEPFVEKIVKTKTLLLLGHAKSLIQFDIFWQLITQRFQQNL